MYSNYNIVSGYSFFFTTFTYIFTLIKSKCFSSSRVIKCGVFFSLPAGKAIIYITFISSIRLCCTNPLFNCLFAILCILNKGVSYPGDREGHWAFVCSDLSVSTKSHRVLYGFFFTFRSSCTRMLCMMFIIKYMTLFLPYQ